LKTVGLEQKFVFQGLDPPVQGQCCGGGNFDRNYGKIKGTNDQWEGELGAHTDDTGKNQPKNFRFCC
jgi:arylsulfatase A-like enzyme